MSANIKVAPPFDSSGYQRERICGLILAGGAGRRMNSLDKGLIDLAGQSLVNWVAEALAPQVGSLLISANRHRERYQRLGWPVLADLPGLQGPLAGIATALAHIQTQPQHQPRAESQTDSAPEIGWLLVSPCDTPLIPDDLGARLACALQERADQIAIAADSERSQPLHALIPVSAGADLNHYLAEGGLSVLGWLARQRVTSVQFEQTPSPFANLNRPEDAAAIRAQLSSRR